MQPRSEKEATIHEFGARLDGIDYVDRPGVYAVIENDEKQIAVIETSRGYFLPGGGIDTGETELEALKRELREETGYEVSGFLELGSAIEYIEAYREQKQYRIRSRFYKAQLGSKIGHETEKDHRLVWLQEEDAIKLLIRPSQVWVIQSLRDG